MKQTNRNKSGGGAVKKENMITLRIICLPAAAICFGLKAFGVNIAGIDLIALGYMFVVLAFIF